MIFRTKVSGWPLVPRPYLLISRFRGPVWVFYGIGQIWLTHRKLKEFDSWIVRAPRVASKRLIAIVDALENELREFIAFCNSHGIEGTIVLERNTIEFHWTFGFELNREKEKPDHAADLDSHFRKLVDSFLFVSSPSVPPRKTDKPLR